MWVVACSAALPHEFLRLFYWKIFTWTWTSLTFCTVWYKCIQIDNFGRSGKTTINSYHLKFIVFIWFKIIHHKTVFVILFSESSPKLLFSFIIFSSVFDEKMRSWISTFYIWLPCDFNFSKFFSLIIFFGALIIW